VTLFTAHLETSMPAEAALLTTLATSEFQELVALAILALVV